MKSSFGRIGCLAVFSLLGIGLSIILSIPFVRAWERSDWTAVQGRIIDTRILKIQKRGPRISGRLPYEVLGLDVRYEFEVEGKRIEGWNVGFEKRGPEYFGALRQKKAEKLLSEYPVGRPVTVYWGGKDSKNQSQLCLDPSFSWEELLIPPSVIFITLALCAAFISSLLRIRRRPTENLDG